MRACLLFVLLSASCVTPFPPGVIDPGRGAEPLPVGTTIVGASLAVGTDLVGEQTRQQALPVVGSAGVARVEHQLNESVLVLADAIAIGFPAQAAFQNEPRVITTALVGAQLNLGSPHLAVRAVGGGGFVHRLGFNNLSEAIPDVHLDA